MVSGQWSLNSLQCSLRSFRGNYSRSPNCASDNSVRFMSIMPGSRIGPYTVTAPIGEGGMGVVYSARDTLLQRQVALKLLPDHFAGDADRVNRFEREAQVLASLNHPNIAQIYGLEKT